MGNYDNPESGIDPGNITLLTIGTSRRDPLRVNVVVQRSGDQWQIHQSADS